MVLAQTTSNYYSGVVLECPYPIYFLRNFQISFCVDSCCPSMARGYCLRTTEISRPTDGTDLDRVGLVTKSHGVREVPWWSSSR